jgi:hypothetical protein
MTWRTLIRTYMAQPEYRWEREAVGIASCAVLMAVAWIRCIAF